MPLTRADLSVHRDVAPDRVPELIAVQQPQLPVFSVTVRRPEVLKRIIDRAEHGQLVLDGRGDRQLRLEQPRRVLVDRRLILRVHQAKLDHVGAIVRAVRAGADINGQVHPGKPGRWHGQRDALGGSVAEPHVLHVPGGLPAPAAPRVTGVVQHLGLAVTAPGCRDG